MVGHSRGGAVSLLHAARDARVRALVTWASIGSVQRWPTEQMAAWRARGYLEVPNARTGQLFRVSTALLDEVEEHHHGRLNLRVAADTLLCPWLIVHGDADETVPFAEAEQLLAASGGRAELRRVGGGTHTFNVAHGMTVPSPQLREAADATVQFLVDRLGARA
jgi:pimeloyl-ACP methyl ester carboxylesterase